MLTAVDKLPAPASNSRTQPAYHSRGWHPMTYPCSDCMREFDNPLDRGTHKAHFRGGRCVRRFGKREVARTANATPFRLRSEKNDNPDNDVPLSCGSLSCHQPRLLGQPSSSTVRSRSRSRSRNVEEAPATAEPRFDSAFELYRVLQGIGARPTDSDIQKFLDLIHHPKFNAREIPRDVAELHRLGRQRMAELEKRKPEEAASTS